MDNSNSSSSSHGSTTLSPKQTRCIIPIPARITKPTDTLDVSPTSSTRAEKSFPSQNLSPRNSLSSPKPHHNDDKGKEIVVEQREDGRARLKRHRDEVAGRVMIPEKWSQESLLRDWMDYSSFDKLLAPKGLASAREALMAEGRSRPSSQRMRIESRC